MIEETYKFDGFEILCGSDEVETMFIVPVNAMSKEDFVEEANRIVSEEWQMREEYGVFTSDNAYECNVRTVPDPHFNFGFAYEFSKEASNETIRAYRIDLE